MVTALRAYRRELPESPSAELTGPDTMYIPTSQIRIAPQGAWHRRGPIATETACGLPYSACASREYQLSPGMCTDGCWTARELVLAKNVIDLPPDVFRK